MDEAAKEIRAPQRPRALLDPPVPEMQGVVRSAVVKMEELPSVAHRPSLAQEHISITGESSTTASDGSGSVRHPADGACPSSVESSTTTVEWSPASTLYDTHSDEEECAPNTASRTMSVDVPVAPALCQRRPDSDVKVTMEASGTVVVGRGHVTRVGDSLLALQRLVMRCGVEIDSPFARYVSAGTGMAVLQVGGGRRIEVRTEHGVGWVSIAKESGEPLVAQRSSRAPTDEGELQVQNRDLGTEPHAAPGSASCDKCDGPHSTDTCPFFAKGREEHKDAWVNYGNANHLELGSDGGDFVLRHAHVVQQPGDGSCLFHALSHGLGVCHPGAATELRQELVAFLEANPNLKVAGDTLEEWVRYDAGLSLEDYVRQLAAGGWGGGLEMVCFSLVKQVHVHVYESLPSGHFKRICCFHRPGARRMVHVLYQGRLHYDALVLDSGF
eukprot:CAMPEP_0194496312 /NCGR_PEP_ID=MMETSP0253-20130528/13629_1 /TAXON_ID=2966 /ORGANISM="Noctiluca scintillans" /LENGTH=441 /DNA_ID=CAMNT_0039337695 /DNA_START=125 /DNA_END=1450 /DNA_ORIENTATION=-